MDSKGDTWTGFACGMNEFSSVGWSFAAFDDQSLDLALPNLNPSLLGLATEPNCACPLTELYPFLDDGFTITVPSGINDFEGKTSIPVQEEYPSMLENYGPRVLGHDEREKINSFEIEIERAAANTSSDAIVSSMGFLGERKSKVMKKVEGQPSKNLMAERRRRKRLNDRLSMLRSIVPKISKMDRTTILGDTINYMKTLLEKIHKLRGEDIEAGMDQMNFLGCFNELNSTEIFVRNPPKFQVERRNKDTRVEIRCAAKPGLLLSTVHAFEALGLDIRQCVLSCFNDFSLQASCSEAVEHRRFLSSEDIKEALFRNAGYSGRCL